MKSSKKKSKHPSLDIVGTYGSELSGKRIVLCVAGSVAVYKAIELARLLMRHGGNVVCVESYAATKLIKPDYFKWATGNDVITKLTGDLEHIDVADYRRSDLIIVYPGTANTLGKLANGIDDTPVSTVLTVGFGSHIPIVMGLAMHAAMYDNKAVRKNIDFLKGKVDFVSPVMIEGKAKAAEPEDVLEFVLKKFGFSSVLHKKRILMTAGPTVEYIDPVRVVTNLSSGKTGVLLASELVSAGAKVTLVYGPGTAAPPAGARVIPVKTTKEMFDAVKKEMKKKFDVVILAAAASDYTVQNYSSFKIKSSQKAYEASKKAGLDEHFHGPVKLTLTVNDPNPLERKDRSDYLGDLDALIGGVFESLQPSPPENNNLKIHPLLKEKKEIRYDVALIVADDAQIATTIAQKRKNERTFYTVMIEADDS